jgi:outer membrane protein OmpA-like peptidoglycan-associated protein
MKARLSFKPISSGLIFSVLCFGAVAYGQNTTNASNNPPNNQTNSQKAAGGGSSADEYPDIVELDPFGGIQTNGQVMRGLDTKLVDGGVAGIRLAVNPSKWIGFELMFDYAQANVEFRVPSNGGVYPATAGAPLAGTPIPTYSFGSRNYYWALNPIFNLRPRGSKVQPYLTVGVGGIQFTPTDTAKGLARSTAINNAYYSANLNDNLQVALNYGGGVKFHLSDHFGLRLDARGFWSRNPTYGLPNYPTGGIYIPSHDKLNSFQGTVGLVFYLGQSKCPPMPPAPPAPTPLPTPTITGGEGTTICQGKPVTLHAEISASGRQLKYAWTLNGAAQSATGPDFTFTPNNVGTFNIGVTVTDVTPLPAPLERPKKFPVRCWVQPPAPQAPPPVTASTSVTVNETAPTITNISATPDTLVASVDQGPHTSQLSATAQGGPCSTNLTYKWTVSEGSLTNDTTPNATFDASTLNFEGGQNQSKTVTATLTVTDENGKTATKTTTITVNYTPPFVRLDDVIFAKNNARVNNCGKRILIDDTAPRLSSGDYDIVLVGHRDNDERENAAPTRTRGRRGRRQPPVPLDEQRVLNAAAVLSGGTATCGHVDPSRIRVDWVGTTQTSDPRPGLCGTSNIKERKGSTTSEADKNRRVEVYLVPHGSNTMPPAVQNVKPLPEDQVKALGCPK